MAEERILTLISKGVEGSVYSETRASRETILGEVLEVLRALREGKITPNIAYNAIYGIVRRWRLALTPREIGEIRKLLGVS